jgi:Leucine-rich repeat (LRR) protein
LNCKDNNLAELTITNCPRLTELNCSNSKLTSLDVSNNPDLLSLYCDFPLYPNIIGLENTSIIKLDVREGISKGEISDPQEIWKILTDIRKKHFPEMKLIDISDLDQLAAQVNKKTANNPKFLTKICPSDPELFTKTQKGNFY